MLWKPRSASIRFLHKGYHQYAPQPSVEVESTVHEPVVPGSSTLDWYLDPVKSSPLQEAPVIVVIVTARTPPVSPFPSC